MLFHLLFFCWYSCFLFLFLDNPFTWISLQTCVLCVHLLFVCLQTWILWFVFRLGYSDLSSDLDTLICLRNVVLFVRLRTWYSVWTRHRNWVLFARFWTWIICVRLRTWKLFARPRPWVLFLRLRTTIIYLRLRTWFFFTRRENWILFAGLQTWVFFCPWYVVFVFGLNLRSSSALITLCSSSNLNTPLSS